MRRVAAEPRVAVVTGGRTHYPSIREIEAVAQLLLEHRITVLRHGDTRGVDRLVGGYVAARGIADVEKWPADWNIYGRSAGPRRNRMMLDGGEKDMFGCTPKPVASLVIALHGGAGTQDCRRAAESRGLRLVDVAPVAEPRPWNRHHGDPSIRHPDGRIEKLPAVYVGEGTPLGNPFRGDLDQDLARAVAAEPVLQRYRLWLWDRIRPGSPDYDPAAVAMLDALSPEHYVVCSCWPRHCHTEYVIAAWRFRQLCRARVVAP